MEITVADAAKRAVPAGVVRFEDETLLWFRL